MDSGHGCLLGMQGVAPSLTLHDPERGSAVDNSARQLLDQQKPHTSAANAKWTRLMSFPWRALLQCTCSLAGVSVGAWLLFAAGDTAK